jgi:DNA-binding XRE family transcriptional regulator
LIAAVEAGRHRPAVDAALRLAAALATTVEDLFADHAPDVAFALGGQLRSGAAVRVGHVGEQLIAAELTDHGVAGAGWAVSDGVFEDGKLRLFPSAHPAGLVLAGCDPALQVAAALLDGLGPRSLLAISASTATAVDALARGSIHGAVVHNTLWKLPKPPIPVERLYFARWYVGVAVPARLRIKSLEAVIHSKLPIAQRDPGAASQQALERATVAAGIAPLRPGPVAAGHIDAARIAAILGGAAVTTEAAAYAFQLGFLPLEEHIVQIWIADRWLDHPGVAALRDLLATTAFTTRIAHFGGYDLTGCGERVGAR